MINSPLADSKFLKNLFNPTFDYNIFLKIESKFNFFFQLFVLSLSLFLLLKYFFRYSFLFGPMKTGDLHGTISS